MLNWRIRPTLMHTVTTKNTTWAAVSPPPRKTTLRVRPYSVARPRRVFLAAEVALLAVVLVQTTWVHGSFEAAIVVGLCGVFFHLKLLDRSIVASDFLRFSRDLSQALAFALASAVVVFRLFPNLQSRDSEALVGACLAGLLPLFLRPILQVLISRQKLVEGILVVGTGHLAERLCRALGSNGASDQEEESKSLLHFPERVADTEGPGALGGFQQFVAR